MCSLISKIHAGDVLVILHSQNWNTSTSATSLLVSVQPGVGLLPPFPSSLWGVVVSGRVVLEALEKSKNKTFTALQMSSRCEWRPDNKFLIWGNSCYQPGQSGCSAVNLIIATIYTLLTELKGKLVQLWCNSQSLILISDLIVFIDIRKPRD